MAEEGVVQVFRPHDGSPAMVGVVGPLQLDVLRVRLKDEYGLEVSWDQSEFTLARWIARGRRSKDAAKAFETFVKNNGSSVADDLDGDPVFLARNQFNLDYTRERAPGIVVHRHQGREEGRCRLRQPEIVLSVCQSISETACSEISNPSVRSARADRRPW